MDYPAEAIVLHAKREENLHSSCAKYLMATSYL